MKYYIKNKIYDVQNKNTQTKIGIINSKNKLIWFKKSKKNN